MKKLLMLATVVLAMAMPVLATDLDNCALISASGDYYLTTDVTGNSTYLSGEATKTCFRITADDVYFDCQNHQIDAQNLGDHQGNLIFVQGTSGDHRTNVTVKNCYLTYIPSVSSENTQLILDYVDNSLIENVTWDASTSRVGSMISYAHSTYIDFIDCTYLNSCDWYGINADTGSSDYIYYDNLQYSAECLVGDLYFEGVDNVTFNNSYLHDFSHVNLQNGVNRLLVNSVFENIGTFTYNNAGVHDIYDCNFTDVGLNIYTTDGVLSGNRFDGGTLSITATSTVDFYDNYVDSTSVTASGTVNFYGSNIAEARIYGAGDIWGNFWVGYSEDCTDADYDGYCDSPYNVYSSYNDTHPYRYYDYCTGLGCNGDDLVQCSGYFGLYELNETCTYSCDANLTQCFDCDSGDQCSGDDLESCVDGYYVFNVTCPLGCDVDACIACMLDATRCNADDLEVCTGIDWSLQESCEISCFDDDHCAGQLEYTMTDVGDGTGAFISAVTMPLGNVLMTLGIVGAVVSVFLGIAYIIKKGISG